MGDHGVEALFERASTALHLSEQESTLQRREHGNREIVRVGSELATLMHLVQASADAGFPTLERGCDVRSGMLVDLG